MRTLISLLITIPAFVSCSSDSQDPKDCVQQYLEAIKSGDRDKGIACIADGQIAKTQPEEVLDPEKKKPTVPEGYRIGDPRIEGQTARVDVSWNDGDKESSLTFVLKKRDGKWKLILQETTSKDPVKPVHPFIYNLF